MPSSLSSVSAAAMIADKGHAALGEFFLAKGRVGRRTAFGGGEPGGLGLIKNSVDVGVHVLVLASKDDEL
jgi:hypothetical protein